MELHCLWLQFPLTNKQVESKMCFFFFSCSISRRLNSMLLIIALNIFREIAPKAKSNITLICGLLVFLFITGGLSF